MMRTQRWIWTVLSTIAMAGAGCSGTSTGNPNVDTDITLEFSSYSQSFWKGFGLPFVSTSVADISNLKLCIAQVAFTAKDGTKSTQAFAIGEKAVSESGTALGTVDIVPGDYTRVELILDSTCASGKSVQATNFLNPALSTADTITLKFDTAFTVGTGHWLLKLQPKPFVDQLDTVLLDALIKTTLEAVTGAIDGLTGH